MQNYMTTQNEFEALSVAQPFKDVSIETEKTRALAEIQGAIIMARKFPRDEIGAYKKIMQAAKRVGLAEKAKYCYPRGGQTITGASIRTAETIAKYWGNIDFGIKELSQNASEHTSDVMTYAWDLETNTRQVKVFKVPHIRYSKAKGNEILYDPRDIYEKIANDAARRLRGCLLGILPADIVEDFLAATDKTLEGTNDKPLADRIKEMIDKFGEIGVTQEMIEKRIGTKATNFVIKNVIDLGAVYNSIRNNFAPISQYFELPAIEQVQAETAIKKLKNTKKTKEQELIPDPEVEQQAQAYFEGFENAKVD